MKQQNTLVKFKNSFLPNTQLHQKLGPILSDNMQLTLQQKIHHLIQIYKQGLLRIEYDPGLAFRIISLIIHADVDTQLDLVDEINRLIKFHLATGELEGIQICMDLIMMDKLKAHVQREQFAAWKIKVLRYLRLYYQNHNKKKDRKKITEVIREMCKIQLNKQGLKRNAQLYNEVLDIAIQEEREMISHCLKKNKKFQAIEYSNNIIRILQKSEHSLIPKYQSELMIGYFDLAFLHFELHYLSYAKKYAEITKNIAERINDQAIQQEMQALLQRIAI